MKKYTVILISLALVLATAACSLPFLNRSMETAPQLPTETFGGTDDPAASVGGGTAVITDNGVALTLPSTFVLGDLNNLQAMSEGSGGGLQQLYAQNEEAIVLWVYDTDLSAGIPTNLLVIRNETYAAIPLGLISTFAGPLLGDSVEILEQDRLTLGNRDTLRFLTSTGSEGVQTGQVVYAFKDAGQLWLVGFLTGQDQISAQLPIYDAVVASFTVLGVE